MDERKPKSSRTVGRPRLEVTWEPRTYYHLTPWGRGPGCSMWMSTLHTEAERKCFCLASLLNQMSLCGLEIHQNSGVYSSCSVCFKVTVACWCSAHLQVDGKQSDEAALILHRKGFDCRFSSRDTGLLCSTTQGKVRGFVVVVVVLLTELVCSRILPLG